MANFTLNSLSTQGLIDTDNFMKSNSDGVLSKTSAQTIKTYITGGNVNVNYADFYAAHQISGTAFVSLPPAAPTTVTGQNQVQVFSGQVTIPVSGLYEVTSMVGLGVETGGGNANMTIRLDSSVISSPSTNTAVSQVMDQSFVSLTAGIHTITVMLSGSLSTTKSVYAPYIKSKINFKYC